MKFQLVSDLHLEFGPITIKNAGADVLILSGDICVANELNDNDTNNLLGEASRSVKYHKFFQSCCENFKHVVYVAGNHEHYHGDYATSLPRLKEKLAYLSNLHVMDKEVLTLGDVTIVAGTLWTDMNKEDPNTLYSIKGYMNDYRIIENTSHVVNYKAAIPKDKPVGMSDEDWILVPYAERTEWVFKTRPAKFCPEDSVEDHKQMLFAIAAALETAPADQKFVIVGHHSPSKLSTKPRYEKDVIVNGAYSSDLSEFILSNPRIKLWTHGHTHHNFDYMIGSTRIVCNPRGYYGYDENHEFNPGMVLEV
jgi:DNA repair exonuclease SbcCD nuclease subunit